MRWGIRDFKGLKDASVDTRPGKLTVLTGVNSSGKSSVLQSLLLATQSLYSELTVVLNGPLVRLGEATDLVREGASSRSVQFAFELMDVGSENTESDAPLLAELELAPTEDDTNLRAQRLSISIQHSDLGPLVLDRRDARSSDVESARIALREPSTTTFLHLKSVIGGGSRPLRTYVAMRGLVPSAVVQLDNHASVAAKYRRELDSFLSEFVDGISGNARQDSRVIVPPLREFVRLIRVGESSGELTERFRKLPPYPSLFAFQEVWQALSREEQKAAVTSAVRARSLEAHISVRIGAAYPAGVPQGLLEMQLENKIRETIRALSSFEDSLSTLARRVEYLGPLRDEPRVIWNQWNELARGLPVGSRGELSASVLSRFGGQPIQYRDPNGQMRKGPLFEAVNEWLGYLEIGEAVEARGLGKLGVGLSLRMSGRPRDLTAVGVGVSQALPIVVAVLFAPPDALFIVEQPELHLHPAVQARLADFLLLARPDLASIVETHSDAFVTRLRRRVAEGSVDTAAVGITFIEPGEEGALSRDLTLNEFGDLSRWPAGFLSTSEEDTSAIIKANITRMAAADAD